MSELLFPEGGSGGPSSDHTVELAEQLGIDLDRFLEIFGADWRESPEPPSHDYDADPTGGEGFPVTPWHIAGEPPQLMIRVFDHGVFPSRPQGFWAGGTHDLRYQPSDHIYVARHEIDREGLDTVRRLLRSRRSAFRYCAHCRGITTPEARLDDLCFGCASAWRGVVY